MQDLHKSEASAPSVLGLGFGLDTRASKRTHSEVGESRISPVAALYVFDCDMNAHTDALDRYLAQMQG